ncbi:MAG: hypothetical protein IT514_16365, partial [Burkholderiales bacterium]|nr:hypothetical protein [Burkholderiales bacterium]
MNDGKQTGWSAVSIRPVPADIAQALEAQGFKPEGCVLCVDSRVLPDGRYGESWLAVGDGRLAVVSRNGHAPSAHWTARLDDVKGASTQKVTGGGVLVVNVAGKPQEVLRYDAGHAPLFGEVAQRIQRHVAPQKKDDKDKQKEEGTAAATAPSETKTPAGPLEFKELLTKQRELTCPSCLRLYPKNTKVCPFCVKRGSTIRRVMGFAKPFRAKILLMAVLMLSGTALHLVEPQIVRILVDDVIGKPQNAGMLLPLIALMGLLMFVNYGIGIWRGRLGIWVGCHVTNSIQGQAFEHLQRLSLSYFNKQQTGALMSRVNNDARQMQGFLVEGIQYTVINVLMVIGVIAMLLWMNPLLGLMLLAPMPVVVVLSAVIWKKIHRRFH